MGRSIAFVTVPADELVALVERACARAVIDASRQAAASVERLSATAAARMAKRRPAVVLQACASGVLPAVRNSKSWSIRASDFDVWCQAGCPVVRS